jgi:ComEC/Rec2-related protein
MSWQCNVGLAWAVGSWCGAALSLSPLPILWIFLIWAWWVFRRVAPLMLPLWALCTAVAGFVTTAQPSPEESGYLQIDRVQNNERGCLAEGILILGPLATHALTVSSRKSLQTGLYAISAPFGQPSLSLLERTSDWRREWKLWWYEQLYEALGSLRAAELYAAMCTGNLDSPDLRMLLGRFGMSHLLALSGLHVTLVMNLFGLLFIRIGLWGRALLILQIVFLLFYLMLVGPYPSALRAGGMALLSLLSRILRRPVDGLHALGVTMATLLLWDPLLSQSMGFQLSCGATLGLLLWARPATKRLLNLWGIKERSKNLSTRFCTVVVTALGCQIAVLPLTLGTLLLQFHEFNVLGLWVNSLVAPLLSMGFAVSLSLPLLGGLVGIPLGWLTEQILDGLSLPWWWDLWTPPIRLEAAEAIGLSWGLALLATGWSRKPSTRINNESFLEREPLWGFLSLR